MTIFYNLINHSFTNNGEKKRDESVCRVCGAIYLKPNPDPHLCSYHRKRIEEIDRVVGK